MVLGDGAGCPHWSCHCDHAAAFPAVRRFLGASVQFLDRVVDFPVACRFGTHSAPWRSHRCISGRGDFPGAAYGPLLTSPCCAAPHAQFGCQGRRHLRRGADAVSYGPGCSENHEIPLLQSVEKVVDVTFGQVQQIPRVLSVETVEIPQLHSSSSLDKVFDMPVVFNDKCLWVSVQKTAKVPQLHALFRWLTSLVCRFRCRRSSAVVNVPVIIQRQVSSLSMWRCLRFSSPAESWTFPLYNRDWYEVLWWR